jgi:preprotein translocase subunit SecG
MGFLDWILIVVSVFLITLVALQSAKGDLGEAITGGNSELFKNTKERGADLFLSRITLALTVLLIVLTFLTRVV